MHEFKYKNNHLYCENIKIEDLAKKFGTPLYVYSYHTLIDHFFKLKNAFKPVDPLICYSVKANSNLAILKALVDKGAGLDIVSGGELYRAKASGVDAKKIVYASVGKTEEEIEKAIRHGILFFNVESIPELELINKVACRLGAKTNVAIRINPDVEPKTHKYITTGKLTNKFGIDFETARIIFLSNNELPHLDICGIHMHIGSQITDSAPYIAALKKIVKFIGELKKRGINLKYLNIGGGLGIIYNKETPQTAKEFSRKIIPVLKSTGLKIIMEPGRFIAGNSGVLITKVLYMKKTPLKNFIIVDGAMNDLVRPSLYGAYHEILPLYNPAGSKRINIKYDVVGPICESGDFLAKDRAVSKISAGEYLAVMSCGAYGFTMSSNYNSRPRACEALVIKNKAFMIRKRESDKDLIRNEHVPNFLLGF
ncbi:MAG: diaminopimelate decarboxylase [Candidatus Omnitrophica bacterium CG11_big_fil_rev_8_21_14_0_20_42_13]|uniref:Diaminopimelate decarboxylase n=1 Tax=Candidatus Ghiorseimicrobium undicola TaxID=1974746 RepID=A0A2H0LWA4_9BACT|nr:MAG: diaminopimelate decarboxylase [Candidatus Omnitrophica bacterium CG11_big_fil_rev_8_21_14_0_20_42_13]